MVTALVQIKLPQPLATAKAQAVFAETAPNSIPLPALENMLE